MDKKISRRTFLKVAGGALLLAGAGGAWYEQRALGRLAKRVAGDVTGAIDASFVRQIVAADNQTARTIMWQSAAAQKEAAVELRAEGGNVLRTFAAESAPYSDDGVSSYLQTARLDGLAPGTAYEYRLRDGQRAGEWQKLRADDGRTFSALVFPDSQSNDYSGWQELARSAYERNPDTDFFINMGDLVDNGEDHRQWEAWFDAVAPLSANIPVAPIMGNHETYDQNWKVRLPRPISRSSPCRRSAASRSAATTIRSTTAQRTSSCSTRSRTRRMISMRGCSMSSRHGLQRTSQRAGRKRRRGTSC